MRYGPLTLIILRLLQVTKSLKCDNIENLCMTLKQEQACLTTFCIVVNGDKLQSLAMTLTLIGQLPISNFYILQYIEISRS